MKFWNRRLVLVRILLCYALVVLPVVAAAQEQDERRGDAVPTSAVAGLHPVLARSDLAVLRAGIGGNFLKGDLGESLATLRPIREVYAPGHRMQYAVIRHAGAAGSRLRGPDLVLVELSPDGTASRAVVVEVKWGSSQLSQTSVGRQLSAAWTARAVRRQAALVRLARTAFARGQVARRAPRAGTPRLSLELPIEGKRVLIWQDAEGNWYYVGGVSAERLQSALEKLEQSLWRNSEFLAAEQRYLIRIATDGETLHVLVDRVVDSEARQVQNVQELVIPLSQGRSRIIETLARHLQELQPGLSKAEARARAEELVSREALPELLEEARGPWWLNRRVVLPALVLVGIDVIVAILESWYRGEDLSMTAARVSVHAASASSGVATAIGVTNFLTSTELGQAIVGWLTASLGYGWSVYVNAFAGGAAAFVATAVYAYLGAMLGLHSWPEAHVTFAAGALGGAASVAAVAAVYNLALLVGTASTGTAIASLSGAAASNAALAWLGFGALSAGGWGIFGGWLVLTGVGVVAYLSVYLTIIFLVHVWHEKRVADRWFYTVLGLATKLELANRRSQAEQWAMMRAMQVEVPEAAPPQP